MSADTGGAASRNGFYYRSERRGKKVVRIYIGSLNDPTTRIIRRIDRNQRARRRLNHLAEIADNDPGLDEVIAAYDVRFHLYRDLLSEQLMKTKAPNGTHQSRQTIRPAPTKDEFLSVVERAEEGSSDAKRDLEVLLDQHPELWRTFGDVGRLVENYLIGFAARKSELLRQSIGRCIGELRESLTKPTNDPLEGLLVDRIITAHLEVAIRQVQATEANSVAATRRTQRTLQQAHRRFLESIALMRDSFSRQQSNA